MRELCCLFDVRLESTLGLGALFEESIHIFQQCLSKEWSVSWTLLLCPPSTERALGAPLGAPATPHPRGSPFGSYLKLLEFLTREDPHIFECKQLGCEERVFLDDGPNPVGSEEPLGSFVADRVSCRSCAKNLEKMSY